MFAQRDQGTSVQMQSDTTEMRRRAGDLQRRACDRNCPTCTSGDLSPDDDRGGWHCLTHSLVEINSRNQHKYIANLWVQPKHFNGRVCNMIPAKCMFSIFFLFY